MDLLQTDTFVSLSGDIDQLFHLYDRFPLFPEINVRPGLPVINILLLRVHGILDMFGLFHLSLGYIDIIPFGYHFQIVLRETLLGLFQGEGDNRGSRPREKKR